MRRNFYRRFYRCLPERDITLEELKQEQQKGAIIIDVRNNREYQEGHINGSINIPEYEINQSFIKIIENKNTPIVLYCSSGYRSLKAYRKLKTMGYTNVHNLCGGLANVDSIV